LKLAVAGAFCSPSGCTETDRITATITTDPGAVTSKVTRTQVLYSPNSGNFVNATSTNYVACQGGSGPCGQSAGGARVGITFVSSTPSQNGRNIMHGYSLNAGFQTTTNRIIDKARMGTASCNKTNNHCYYR
jgi:hypothetical protein